MASRGHQMISAHTVADAERNDGAPSGMLRAVIRLLMVIGAGIVGILFILVLIVRLRAANTKFSPEELVATLKNAGLVELLAMLGGAGEVFLFEAALLACATLI